MMVANILAIVGSIILVVIIIWGLIHLLSLSGGFFSGLFGDKASSTKISVTAPSEVTSGVQTSISWKHDADETGTYALIYPCTEGLRFATHGASGSMITMPCGAAYTVGQSTTSASILPMLIGSSTVRTPFSVLFLPSSTSTPPAEGTVTISVKPASGAPSTPVTPEPTKPEPTVPEPTTPKPTTPKPTTPKPTTPVSTGPADLAVTLTSVTVDSYGNGTAVFHISNVGGSSTGSYYFTAQLPTMQPYTYVSPAQSSLAPGSYIVNTLRFTQATAGNVHVAVDTTNNVAEQNEGNNTATQYVTSAYDYNYQYPYPTY